MSARFIAHVERPDGRVHHINCDAAHENDTGRLSLTVNTYIGAIAAYAPGAWASYRLEAAPEPVTSEQVERGEKSLNDYRRYLGMPPIADETSTATADRKAQRGDNVHVTAATGECMPGVVDDLDGYTLQIDTFGADPQFAKKISRSHDETRQIPGSWHWPHDDGQAAKPEPDAPTPVTINVHVEGSVLSEKKLQDVIASQLSRAAAMRGFRW